MLRLSFYECSEYHNELIKKAEIERLVKKFRKNSEKKIKFGRDVERLYQPRIQTNWGLG
jgi:hypothetical protein